MLPEVIQGSRVRPDWCGLGLNAANEHDHKAAGRAQQELDTDLKLLLECLKYHENNPDVLKDGLLTVSSICLENSQAQDYFRDSGGLNFVLNLLTTCSDETVTESAMYTLGCATERNVFSQKRLCTRAVFRFLECKLVDAGASSKLKRTVAYLLLCLVSNNSAAQSLISSSHCLDALLDIFRCQYPGFKHDPDSPNPGWIDRSTHPEESSLELWKAITSTLIGCVNNPQNEANQRDCTSVFPVALQILSDSKDPQVIRLLASFLSLTADNNGRIQDRLGMLGGMDTIVNALQTVVESLVQEPSPDCTDAAMQLASVMVSCVTDNKWNKMTLADLRVVPLLVQLLALDVIEIEVKLKIVLTLGHLTDGCELSQRQLVESDGLGLIVHTMTGQQDEEFTKAATYLLHTCVRVVNSSDDTGFPRNMPIPQHPSLVHGIKKNQQNANTRSIPVVKPRIKKNNVSSPRSNGSEKYETESVKSAASLKTKPPREPKVARTDEGLTDKLHTDNTATKKATKDAEANDKTDTDCTTVEALFKEISTRKELELKLQKEIQAREDLQADKITLEKREEERITAENVTKEKAQALTKELERQYLLVVNKPAEPDIVMARAQETQKECDDAKLDNSKSGIEESKKPITTNSSTSDVQILEKKVEELQKQLQEHITHNSDQQSNHDASTCSMGSPTSETCSSVKRRKIKARDKESHQKKYKIDSSIESPRSVDTRSTSSRRSHKTAAKSLFQSPHEVEGSVSISSKIVRSIKKRTPNLRRTTHPQASQSVFRLPSSTITRSQKIKQENPKQISKQNDQESNKSDRKRSSTPRPTYAEEVLPYKQQKYNSPLELPKHRAPSTSNDEDDDESDLESILTDLTDSYSVADSNVSWSDVMLNLPVRAVGRKSKVQRRERSKHGGRKPHSVQSSGGSSRSKRSFTVRIKDAFLQNKHAKAERQSVSLTSPSSSKSALNCPGCDPPVHRPLLTSRNFLYTLEKSRHTCPEHRELQKVIKDDINYRKKLLDESANSQASHSRQPSVYDEPHTSRRKTAEPVPVRPHRTNRTPRSVQKMKQRDEYDYTTGEESTPKFESHMNTANECDKPRRKRQDFSQEEIDNLLAGVKKSGKHWNFILWSYKFKPGRTAVDLKDKYRRLQTQNATGILPRSPTVKQSKRHLQWN